MMKLSSMVNEVCRMRVKDSANNTNIEAGHGEDISGSGFLVLGERDDCRRLNISIL